MRASVTAVKVNTWLGVESPCESKMPAVVFVEGCGFMIIVEIKNYELVVREILFQPVRSVPEQRDDISWLQVVIS